MPAKVARCVSCGIGLIGEGYTILKCPNCNSVIGRCKSCREKSTSYKCPNCEFTGP